NHIRLSGLEIKNVPATQGSSAEEGILITVDLSAGLYSDHNEILNSTIHDIGGTSGDGNYEHAMYIQSNYNLIDGVETYNNSAYGLQIYEGSGPTDGTVCSNNIVRNSKFHNDSIGTSPGGGEVLVGMGQNNVLYNNLVYNSLGGILVNYG